MFLEKVIKFIGVRKQLSLAWDLGFAIDVDLAELEDNQGPVYPLCKAKQAADAFQEQLFKLVEVRKAYIDSADKLPMSTFYITGIQRELNDIANKIKSFYALIEDLDEQMRSVETEHHTLSNKHRPSPRPCP